MRRFEITTQGLDASRVHVTEKEIVDAPNHGYALAKGYILGNAKLERIFCVAATEVFEERDE